MSDKPDDELPELMHAIAHDLRNPLAAIMTNMEFARGLIARDAVDPDLADAIEDSFAACTVLQTIVANLEVVLRRERLAGSLNRVEVVALIRDALSRCRPRAQQAGVELELDVAAGLEERRVVADRGLLSLALENVIANGLQHGARGTTVTVAVRATEAELRIEVTDQGGAIPLELRELAVSGEGHTQRGRKPGSRYGRGLGLLAANVAALAAGARLELGGEARTSVNALVLPELRATPD